MGCPVQGLREIVAAAGPLASAGRSSPANLLLSPLLHPVCLVKYQLKRPGVSLPVLILASCVVVGVGCGVYYYFAGTDGDSHGDLIWHTVERDRFDHIVLEQGEIESSSNTEVICEVESMGSDGTAILWVIDEGTSVEKGDLLIQLDQSKLENDLQQQRIAANAAAARVIGSEGLLQQATIARLEYLEGTYQTEEKTILSEIAVAEQESRKSQLAEASTRRLVAKGLVKSLQLQADTYAVANARNQLESAQGRLRVLQELTLEKMTVQFAGHIGMAQAQLESERSILEEEQAELKKLERQIAACTIHAPASGVVVYVNEYGGRSGGDFVVEPGAKIRERQSIVRLPDPSRMQVKATISEGRITLVEEGMPVKLRVAAIEGLELDGRVTKVARYPEPGSWLSSSVKEYATLIEILDPSPTIRTGMTADVHIFVQSLNDALQVPIQGVYQHGGKAYVLVREGRNFATREVEVLATNDSIAAIKSGLEVGEEVVLNIRSNLELLDLPHVEDSAAPIEAIREAIEEAQLT